MRRRIRDGRVPVVADPIEPVSLRAGELLLRPWRPDDAAAVHRICQDPDILRWTTVPSPYPPEAAEAFVVATAEQWASGVTASWAVVDTADAVLASVSLSDLDRGYPELGFWVAPEARGRGVSAAASREACRWAFDRGAPKVLWLADVGNEASWRVARQVGFAYEGRRFAECGHRDGHRTDAWAASLLPGALDGPVVPLPYEPFTPLQDGEVTVRRWRETDAEAYAALQNEPSVARWDAATPELTIEAAAARLRGAHVEDWMLGRVARLAICVDEVVVGDVQVRTPSYPPGTGELGWSLRSTARGRGVATRAVGLVRDWAFGGLGLRRLLAGVDVGNTRSRALAERLGFRHEGVHRSEAPRVDGTVHDGLSFGLLPTDLS